MRKHFIEIHSLKHGRRQMSPKGFMLMDVLLAFTIFILFVGGVTFAIQTTARLQETIQRDLWLKKQKENIITQVLRMPVSRQEYLQRRVIEIDGNNANAVVTAHVSTETTKDELILSDLYDIKVELTWYHEGKKQQDSFVIKNYYPLYN